MYNVWKILVCRLQGDSWWSDIFWNIIFLKKSDKPSFYLNSLYPKNNTKLVMRQYLVHSLKQVFFLHSEIHPCFGHVFHWSKRCHRFPPTNSLPGIGSGWLSWPSTMVIAPFLRSNPFTYFTYKRHHLKWLNTNKYF